MPWTDQPGPRPQRSEEQLLDAVRRRAGAIRRARRARLSAGLGGVVAVLLVAAALARAGDDPSSELRVVGPASTTSTTVVSATSVAADATTTTAPAETTTTTVVPATVPPTTRTTPPTTEAPTTTTTAPPATTSTTAPVTRVTCDASEVLVTATPDRSTYPQGSTVTVTAAALNRGSRVCFTHDPKLEFFNAAGAGVGGVAVADAFTMGGPNGPPPAWDPGETLSLPFQWPQRCGAGDPCPPGQYTVIATFGPFRSAPATFTVAP